MGLADAAFIDFTQGLNRFQIRFVAVSVTQSQCSLTLSLLLLFLSVYSGANDIFWFNADVLTVPLYSGNMCGARFVLIYPAHGNVVEMKRNEWRREG